MPYLFDPQEPRPRAMEQPAPSFFHSIRFLSSPDRTRHRAECSCGWTMEGESLETIQGRAACHDLDEVEAA